MENFVLVVMCPRLKNCFLWVVGNDLFMGLWLVGVRSCTSGSPHTLSKRELFGSCCCCYIEYEDSLPRLSKLEVQAHQCLQTGSKDANKMQHHTIQGTHQ